MKDVLQARSFPEGTWGVSISTLSTVWSDLLDTYPRACSESHWHRKSGLLPTRLASLIELTLTLTHSISPCQILCSGVFRGWPDPEESEEYQNPLECREDRLRFKLRHSGVLFDNPDARHFILQSLLAELLARNSSTPARASPPRVTRVQHPLLSRIQALDSALPQSP